MLWLFLACKLPEIDTGSTVPEYEVECESVSCPNASSATMYSAGNEITCTWDCANYEDKYGVRVTIEFYKPETECFYVNRITVSDGYCNIWY